MNEMTRQQILVALDDLVDGKTTGLMGAESAGFLRVVLQTVASAGSVDRTSLKCDRHPLRGQE